MLPKARLSLVVGVVLLLAVCVEGVVLLRFRHNSVSTRLPRVGRVRVAGESVSAPSSVPDAIASVVVPDTSDELTFPPPWKPSDSAESFPKEGPVPTTGPRPAQLGNIGPRLIVTTILSEKDT